MAYYSLVLGIPSALRGAEYSFASCTSAWFRDRRGWAGTPSCMSPGLAWPNALRLGQLSF